MLDRLRPADVGCHRHGDALPAQLQAKLRARGLNVVIRAAGVSGDTSADALARVDFSETRRPTRDRRAASRGPFGAARSEDGRVSSRLADWLRSFYQ